MKDEIIQFLQQSNYIENEYSSIALDDAIKAWDYLIAQDNLTFDRILETHKILMGRLFPEIAGKFRNVDVRVGHQICPSYEKVLPQITSWLKTVNATDFHCVKNDVEEIQKAAIKVMHIDFEYIHPFQDGNGRIGRIILNWQRKKLGLPILVIHEGYEQREYYKWFQK